MTLWYIWSPLLWIIVMVPGLLLLTYWAASAVWHRQPNGVPLLIGLGLMGGFLTLDILFGFNNSIEKIGQQIGAIGFILFLFSLAVAVGLRIFETEKALLEANAYALRAHERERARLARDIHDGIGHWLSTIKLNLQMLRDGVVTGKPSSDANIDEVIGDVSKAIEDTRRIAHDLSPVLLENQGLVGAMRSHADRVAKGQGVKITVSGPQNLDLPDQVRDNLYRIYQEAVSNAVNHSQGTEINAALTNEGGVLTLTVDDNGIEQAHRPEPSGTTSGMGIRSMSERANLLGGKFVLKGNSAGGTSIKVTLPIGSNLGSS